MTARRDVTYLVRRAAYSGIVLQNLRQKKLSHSAHGSNAASREGHNEPRTNQHFARLPLHKLALCGTTHRAGSTGNNTNMSTVVSTIDSTS